MGGGLMQLVAYGAQDVYLTGNPQITYFKVVYRRHTNFSIECIEQPIDNPKFGGRQTVQVLRNGDLATRMYLRAELPPVTDANVGAYNSDDFFNTRVAWVRRVGHALINTLELTIGGSQIDKHWGTWLDVWYELTHTTEQERGYDAMIGDVPQLIVPQGLSSATPQQTILPAYTLYIPLQFWFCRNTGLALPLIALQYHEVRINIELTNVANLLISSGENALVTNNLFLGSVGLMVDYIYLDSEERRRFAQVGHEYLIEQLQFGGAETLVASSGAGTVNQKHTLNFNHPTKEIVWAPILGAWNNNVFLTYSGDDSQWGSAVDYAAENIADGMFLLASADAVLPAAWVNLILPAVSANSSAYVTPLNTPTYAGSTTTPVITVLVNNSGTTLTQAVTEDAPSALWVNLSVLSQTTNSLCSFVENILVTLDVAGVGGAADWDSNTETYLTRLATGATSAPVALLTGEVQLLPMSKVKVVSHNLSLTDVSIPISELTDTRAYTETTTYTAKSVRDVLVNQPYNYGLRLDGTGNLVQYGQLKLNGHDRFSVQNGSYFNYVQPAQHHTRTPADGINVYSFALHPEQHQPSGSANLSRIDTTILSVSYTDSLRSNKKLKLQVYNGTLVYIFAFSYNVLRIMSGMGGLAYAN
jgi:hypothetical protein